MAQRKQKVQVDPSAILRDAEKSLERDSFVKLASVKPASLRPAIAAELRGRGFEVTNTVVRVPLLKQLEAALQHGALIPLKTLSSHVRGASAKELKELLATALVKGVAFQALRGRAEVVVGASTSVVSGEQLSALRDQVAGLNKALEKAEKSKRLVLLAADVNESLTMALEQVRAGTFTRPKQGDPLGDVLAAVDATRDAKSGLSFVPAVVEKLAPRFDALAVGRLLLGAAQNDLLELRPEGGIARLSEAELALCPRGPHGTRLSWARRIAGGRA